MALVQIAASQQRESIVELTQIGNAIL